MRTVKRVLEDKVLVRTFEEKTDMVGSIIIPDIAQEEVNEGEVIMKGPLVNGEVDLGDRIMFGKYAGIEMKVDGLKHYVMRAKDILVVFDK